MTVVTGWDLFEDMRDAQDELLRFNRLRAQGLGQFGQYYGGGTAKGERHDAHHSSEEMVHRVERRYGRFLRSITLPTHVMADAIEASTQDGVLQIMVPKAPEVQAKRIQVHASQKHANPAPTIEGETSN